MRIRRLTNCLSMEEVLRQTLTLTQGLIVNRGILTAWASAVARVFEYHQSVESIRCKPWLGIVESD